MDTFKVWLEARAAKGAPTSLNIWTMFDSLEKGDGVISDRVPPTDLPHLRRCLQAGFLERGPSGGFVPTRAGVAADPDYRRPDWMGDGPENDQVGG
jgi:hypothetical protein